MKKNILLLLLIVTYSLQAQLLTERFESGTFPPAGWIQVQTGTSDDQDDTVWFQQAEYESSYHSHGWSHTGSFSAGTSFGFDDTYESYLITPQFTPTASNHVLNFFFKQAYPEEYGGSFRIKISTATQNTLSDFTLLDEIVEANAPINFELHTIDLTSYVGTPIYIAFVNYDDDGDGDEWYLDDVTLEPIAVPGPTVNPYPADMATGVRITNTQTSEINFSWGAPTTGGIVDQYDFFIGSTINHLQLLGHPTTMSAHPKIFHFNTTYYWKAAAVNMSGESSDTWQFTTCDFPTVNSPYLIDFENSGFVPDGMDQTVDNVNKFWHYANDPTQVSHLGNATNTNGTQTASGGYFAFVKDYGDPSPHGTALFTPYIDISTLTNPAFSIYIISDNEGGLNVDFTIYAKDGANWINVFNSNTNTNGWEEKLVDLSSYNLPNITQFKFVVTEPTGSANHDDFAIDDFKVNDLSTFAIDEVVAQQFSIYPNPVKDILSISSIDNVTPSKIEIYNLDGKLLSVTKNSKKVQVSDLTAGNYFIKIYNNKGNSITKKILKK